MNIERYKKELEILSINYKVKIKEIDKTYIDEVNDLKEKIHQASNPPILGSVLTDDKCSIIVERYYFWGGKTLVVTYVGALLTKKGVPHKLGFKSSIYKILT